MQQKPKTLHELIEPVVDSMGYELVGIEYVPSGSHSLLRIYIDKEGGIMLDDCQKVSYQVSGLLDVEEPIQGKFNLEVSSPGLDRPLFKESDFERFAGHRVKIQMHGFIDGQRKFKGVLQGLQEGQVILLDNDGVEFLLPFNDIDKARLVPDV
ncbi:MAG: ribosome maturation factor RimP [Gammaproteobacteria bacterium]|nr:ribosome maturation factor RimP [Gammaproteobacteria bacterium]